MNSGMNEINYTMYISFITGEINAKIFFESGVTLDFPTIHTNFWDAVIAIPAIIILTQILKILFPIPRKYVSTIALVLGLFLSIFISHRHHLLTGIFMGWFYGYASIGNYSALKTAILSFRESEQQSK